MLPDPITLWKRSNRQGEPTVCLLMQIRTAHGATTAGNSLGHDAVQMIDEQLDRSELSTAGMSMNSQIRQSEQSISLRRLAFEVDGLATYTKGQPKLQIRVNNAEGV